LFLHSWVIQNTFMLPWISHGLWSLQNPLKHMFCLQAFSESEPELSSILHTGCYYVETVLTSPCGINFNRRYQFSMNQKPLLLSSLGMIWIERLDVPKSKKPQTMGGFFVTPFENLLKTSLIHMLHLQTMSASNTGTVLTPQLQPVTLPLPAPRAPPPPPRPGGDGGPRAGVLCWR